MPILPERPLASMSVSLLASLLLVDCLAIVGQLAGSIGAYLAIVPRTPYLLRLEEAYGVASIFNYGKWLAIALFLGLAWRAARQPLLLGLSLIFILLLAEDSLELHERLGTALRATLRLDDQLGLRGADLGELAAWALIGLPCLIAFAHAYARSSTETRRLGHGFLLGIVGLAFFAVVVDMLSAMTSGLGPSFGASLLRLALRLSEEGGELVIASLLVAFAAGIWRASAATHKAQAPTGAARPAIARPTL